MLSKLSTDIGVKGDWRHFLFSGDLDRGGSISYRRGGSLRYRRYPSGTSGRVAGMYLGGRELPVIPR